MREGVPDRLDPVRPLRRARRDARKGASSSCTSAGSRARTSTAPATTGPEQLAGGLGAFFLLTEPPERFGLPAQADSPIQENGPVANLAGVAAAFVAAAGSIATLVVAHRRSAGEPPPPQAPTGGGDARASSAAASTGATSRRRSARAASPGRWRRAVEGAKVALHRPRWGDARWSYLFGRDTRYAVERADDGEVAAAARAARGREDVAVRRPGADDARRRSGPGRCRSTSGSAGSRPARRSSALACDVAGDHALGARSRARWRSAR